MHSQARTHMYIRTYAHSGYTPFPGEFECKSQNLGQCEYTEKAHVYRHTFGDNWMTRDSFLTIVRSLRCQNTTGISKNMCSLFPVLQPAHTIIFSQIIGGIQHILLLTKFRRLYP